MVAAYMCDLDASWYKKIHCDTVPFLVTTLKTSAFQVKLFWHASASTIKKSEE